MKLFKIIGFGLQIASALANAVSANSEAGRTVSPGEAKEIASPTVDLILAVAPALDTAAKKSIGAALREAAAKLEADA